LQSCINKAISEDNRGLPSNHEKEPSKDQRYRIEPSGKDLNQSEFSLEFRRNLNPKSPANYRKRKSKRPPEAKESTQFSRAIACSQNLQR